MTESVSNEKLGFQVTGFVLGIVSMLIALLPGLVLVTATLGIIFSSLGSKRSKLKGLAIAGIVLGIVAAVINALVYGLFELILNM